MKLATSKIYRQTQGFCDIHDLTDEVRLRVRDAQILEGQLTIFVVGSTAGITTIEFEPGLVKDMERVFEKIAPQAGVYSHEEAWRDGNGFAHVRASLLKPSLVVPILQGEPTLGTWQQIVLIDFDNMPRKREIVIQILGE